MISTESVPDFKCPFCKFLIQRANVEKHLLRPHQDSHTIHKYQPCEICGEFLLKNKLTPPIYAINMAFCQESGSTGLEPSNQRKN